MTYQVRPPAHASGGEGAWYQVHPRTVPQGRYDTSAAFDGTGVVMFGGLAGDTETTLGETWTWDGGDWTLRHPVRSPSPRWGAQLAWDGTEVVLFGGNTSRRFDSATNELWTWDGNTWTGRSALHPPPATTDARLAYDGSGFVMYTGQTAQGDFTGSTWTLTRTGQTYSWTERVTPTSPGTRGGEEMSYDRSRNVALLTGGTNGGPMYDDVWYWDGTSWSNRGQFGVPSSGKTMAFDGVTEVLLATGQTHTWTGNGWREQAGVTPAGNGGHVIAEDERHSNVVLFGGYNGANSTILDETWIWSENGVPPPPTSPPPIGGTGGPTPSNAPGHGTTPGIEATRTPEVSPTATDTSSATPAATPTLAPGGIVGGSGGGGGGPGGIPVIVIVVLGALVLLGGGGLAFALATGRLEVLRSRLRRGSMKA
ncbi:MAG: large repetitive protein [Chloroflexota bacterium]|jgi:hypothetical protein|nr:large repetitive protein [Chloroflexota bacterium]